MELIYNALLRFKHQIEDMCGALLYHTRYSVYQKLVANYYKINPHDLPMKKQAFENSTSIWLFIIHGANRCQFGFGHEKQKKCPPVAK